MNGDGEPRYTIHTGEALGWLMGLPDRAKRGTLSADDAQTLPDEPLQLGLL